MRLRNGFRRPNRPVLLAVIAALTVTVGGLARAELPAGNSSGAAAPHDVAPSTSTMFDHQPALLVVGDSYATGYPDMIAEKMGWSLSLDVQSGTGFLPHTDTPSPAHAPFIDRLDRDASTYHADYVLIDGGRNDLNSPSDQVVDAAQKYISGVRAAWPKAKVVVILPAFATTGASPNYPAIADGMRHAADEVGGYVIDPAEQRWYTDVVAKYLLGQDGQNLNYNGDVYYAGKIGANLTQMFDRKPMMLVVGDSFAGGTGDPNFPTYPTVIAREKGWNVAVDAAGGSGFVHRVPDAVPPSEPFIDRLAADAAIYHRRMDYVVIDGGRGDLYDPPEPVLAAADDYIKKVRAAWPNAKIVVVLPSYAVRDVPVNYPVLAQGLRSSAESVGAQVIDPIAQHWYRDVDVKQLLWKDGVNLNGEGNAYYAAKIIQNLARMGIAS